MRFVPYQPLEDPPDVKARRLAELEDEHVERSEFFSVADERRFGHWAPAWVLEAYGTDRR